MKVCSFSHVAAALKWSCGGVEKHLEGFSCLSVTLQLQPYLDFYEPSFSG